MPTDMVNVPIMVSLLLIVLFLLLGAAAFSAWFRFNESQSWPESFWRNFICQNFGQIIN
jgi:TRAP-type mannitol/chloroaromatic compound transport system permease large subunit